MHRIIHAALPRRQVQDAPLSSPILLDQIEQRLAQAQPNLACDLSHRAKLQLLFQEPPRRIPPGPYRWRVRCLPRLEWRRGLLWKTEL